MLDSITKDDFEAHFNNLFFGPNSRRLDVELVSEKHAGALAQALEANNSDEAFAGVLKRGEAITSYAEFQAKMSYYDDTLKLNFI